MVCRILKSEMGAVREWFYVSVSGKYSFGDDKRYIS